MNSLTAASPGPDISGAASASSTARSRSPEQPQGRSFSQTLERSRQPAPQDGADTPAEATAPPRRSKTAAGQHEPENPQPSVVSGLAELLLAAARPIALERPAGGDAPSGAAAPTSFGRTATVPGSASPASSQQAAAFEAVNAKLAAALASDPAQPPALQDIGKQATQIPQSGVDAAPVPGTGAMQTLAALLTSTQPDSGAAPATAVGSGTPDNAARPAPSAFAAGGGDAAMAGRPAAPTGPTGADAIAGTTALDELPAAAPGDAAMAWPADAPASQEPPLAPAPTPALPGFASGTASAAAPATAERLPVSVAPAVGSSEWGSALGQQLIRLGPGGQHVAELNLNPAQLGPLKVTLTVSDNQAQIQFVSAHAAVRQAVEAALPQLRSTFADNGISLGQTSVGADSQQPRQQDPSLAQHLPERPAAPPLAGAAHAAPQPAGPALALRRQGEGVDTFA